MKKVFIIQGFRGAPNGGWKPWLMVELEKQDIYACSLPMPTPNEPKKEEWAKTIAEVVGNSNEDEIFLVGHSLGVPAILRYLETIPEAQKVAGSVLVSGPCSLIKPEDKEAMTRKIDNFLETPFNFEHIKKVCKIFCIIHGDNDDKVPFSHAEELSKNLNCKLISIPNGGHLNGSSGWNELPEALQALNEMMK